jgi:hypothetical protein
MTNPQTPSLISPNPGSSLDTIGSLWGAAVPSWTASAKSEPQPPPAHQFSVFSGVPSLLGPPAGAGAQPQQQQQQQQQQTPSPPLPGLFSSFPPVAALDDPMAQLFKPAATASAVMALPVCRFHLAGSCTRGEVCTFSHGGPGRKATGLVGHLLSVGAAVDAWAMRRASLRPSGPEQQLRQGPLPVWSWLRDTLALPATRLGSAPAAPPSLALQDKFFAFVLKSYETHVAAGREGLVGGARLLVDLQEEVDPRAGKRRPSAKEMAEAAGARVLEVRINGMALLQRDLAALQAQHRELPAPQALASFLLDNVARVSTIYGAPAAGSAAPAAGSAAAPALAFEFVVYLGTGSSFARLVQGGDPASALDEDLAGPRLAYPALRLVAQAFNDLFAALPRGRVRWSAKAVLAPREVTHSLYDMRGVEPGRVVFAEYTDPEGFFAAYANSAGFRPGVDWPFIVRPRLGVFGGPMNEYERQSCVSTLFMFIAAGAPREFGQGTAALTKRTDTPISAPDLYQPPPFLDPLAFSCEQIADFAVSHMASVYNEARLPALASLYAALLDADFKTLGLQGLDSYLHLILKPLATLPVVTTAGQ